jgi:hypothetical protein
MVAELQAIGRELRARAASSGSAPPSRARNGLETPPSPRPDHADRMVDGDTRR